MHEFEVMSGIVKAVLAEGNTRNDIDEVKEVFLEIGELTFLNPEQLEFAYGVITEGTLLEGSALTITKTPAVVRCTKCDYVGPLEYVEQEGWHLQLPVFSCPKCDEPVEIMEGKECRVTNMKAVLKDGAVAGD